MGVLATFGLLAALRSHLADLVFDNDGLVLLDDESARANIELVLEGFEARGVCLEPDLDDYGTSAREVDEYASRHRHMARGARCSRAISRSARLARDKGQTLTGVPKPRGCSVAVPTDDPALVAGHPDDAIVTETQHGARRRVPRDARDVEADPLAVRVAAQKVAPVDKGGLEGGLVAGLGDEGAEVGDEGDVEEVWVYHQGSVDVDLLVVCTCQDKIRG